jgi:hypothetical protein
MVAASKDHGKVGVSIICIILIIIALSLDQLSYYPDASKDCFNDDDAYAYCGYSEFRAQCQGIKFTGKWEDCKDDSDDCEATYNAGQTFESLTIIGLIICAIGVALSLPFSLRFRTFVRFIYIFAGLSLLVAFITWASDGCQAHDDDSGYELGASSYCVLVAGILALADGVFEWFW